MNIFENTVRENARLFGLQHGKIYPAMMDKNGIIKKGTYGHVEFKKAVIGGTYSDGEYIKRLLAKIPVLEQHKALHKDGPIKADCNTRTGVFNNIRIDIVDTYVNNPEMLEDKSHSVVLLVKNLEYDEKTGNISFDIPYIEITDNMTADEKAKAEEWNRTIGTVDGNNLFQLCLSITEKIIEMGITDIDLEHTYLNFDIREYDDSYPLEKIAKMIAALNTNVAQDKMSIEIMAQTFSKTMNQELMQSGLLETRKDEAKLAQYLESGKELKEEDDTEFYVGTEIYGIQKVSIAEIFRKAAIIFETTRVRNVLNNNGALGKISKSELEDRGFDSWFNPIIKTSRFKSTSTNPFLKAAKNGEPCQYEAVTKHKVMMDYYMFEDMLMTSDLSHISSNILKTIGITEAKTPVLSALSKKPIRYSIPNAVLNILAYVYGLNSNLEDNAETFETVCTNNVNMEKFWEDNSSEIINIIYKCREKGNADARDNFCYVTKGYKPCLKMYLELAKLVDKTSKKKSYNL